MVRPELLISPLLPPPLKKISPREVLGDKWWNQRRKESGKKNADLCGACGTHKSAKSCSCGLHYAYKPYLEAHEIYNIDYQNKTVTFLEVATLCHSCHNFIHAGRLMKQYIDGFNSPQYTQNILSHGVEILARADLKPTSSQAIAYLVVVKGKSLYEAQEYVMDRINTDIQAGRFWYNWKMLIENKTYFGGWDEISV